MPWEEVEEPPICPSFLNRTTNQQQHKKKKETMKVSCPSFSFSLLYKSLSPPMTRPFTNLLPSDVFIHSCPLHNDTSLGGGPENEEEVEESVCPQSLLKLRCPPPSPPSHSRSITVVVQGVSGTPPDLVTRPHLLSSLSSLGDPHP